MILFTAQMSKWRQLKERNIELIDTTVKTGELAFAPEWNWVMTHKSGELDDDQYAELYYAKMRHSYRSCHETWNRLLLSTGPVALACFCTAGNFCHRHLLKDILEKLCQARGIPFEYYGEFT